LAEVHLFDVVLTKNSVCGSAYWREWSERAHAEACLDSCMPTLCSIVCTETSDQKQACWGTNCKKSPDPHVGRILTGLFDLNLVNWQTKRQQFWISWSPHLSRNHRQITQEEWNPWSEKVTLKTQLFTAFTHLQVTNLWCWGVFTVAIHVPQLLYWPSPAASSWWHIRETASSWLATSHHPDRTQGQSRCDSETLLLNSCKISK
jgi:hypothetical protein